MIHKHRITLEFETARPLNEEERENLLSLLVLQVEEPQTMEGESEEYSTGSINIEYQEEAVK